MVATVELAKIAPSKISARNQILFIELMSIVRQIKIKSFIFGWPKLLSRKDSRITTGILIITNTLKVQSYSNTSGR